MPASSLCLKGEAPANAIGRTVALPSQGTFARLVAVGQNRFALLLNTMMADGSQEWPDTEPGAWGEAVETEDSQALVDAFNTATGAALGVA